MNATTSPFIYVGNNLGVDFINTELVSNGQAVDLLASDADILKWALDAGLNVDRSAPAINVKTALALRAALKDCFTAKIDARTPAPGSLATINHHLANHTTRQVLQLQASEFVLTPAESLLTFPSLLGRIAHEAATLLASDKAGRLKRCGNAQCILLFVDTSRSQKRRWCSMETCGNRAKAAKHYRKTRS